MGNIIKLSEISKIYTNRLSELLQMGYVMNPSTMPGTQGEYGRMDLTKDGGKTVRRIYIDRGHEYNRDLDSFDCFDFLTIIEEEFNTSEFGSTLWNGKGNKINEQRFYLLDRKRNVYEMNPWTTYTTDLNFLSDCNKKHYSRADSRHSQKAHTFKATPKVLEVIKKFQGFKTTKMSDLDLVEVGHYESRGHEVYFRIAVKGKKNSFTLDKDTKKFYRYR